MTIHPLSRLFASGAVAAALTIANAAHAAEYELKFTGTDVSGDVFANASGPNVTSISGWVMDSEVAAGAFAITGLSAYASSDNTFGPTSPYVDFGGLSFTTATGGDYNLANIGSADAPQLVLLSSVLDPGGGVQTTGLTDIGLTVIAVPEPSTVALMLAAALGLLGLRRRREAV